MAEYIERETAYKTLTDYYHHTTETMHEALREALNRVPAADVAPVVRCKECRHRDPEDHKCDSGEMERQGCPFPVHDDYFCAYGARMDGGEP